MRYRTVLPAVAAASMILASAARADFNPRADVSACLIWLDASDVDGNGAADTIKDGAAIARWADRSGRGHHAVQKAGKLQPAYGRRGLGGKPALVFDGDDFLASTALHNWSDDWTLFAVASLDRDASNNWRGIVGNRFGKGAPHWWTLGTKSDGTCYLELAAGKGVFTKFVPGRTGPQIYSVTKRGVGFELRRNGVGTGTASMANVGGRSNELRVGRWCGAAQGWDGKIAEIIIYDRTLSAAERQAVESYLSVKWGIVLTRQVYSKRATWRETMLASRAALRRHRALDQRDLVRDVWGHIEQDFPAESDLMKRAAPDGKHLAWFTNAGDVDAQVKLIGQAGKDVRRALDALVRAGVPGDDPRWLELYLKAAAVRETFRTVRERLERFDCRALRMSIRHLVETFPERYAKRADSLQRLEACEKELPAIRQALTRYDEAALARAEAVLAFRREALLANPLLDFDRLLLVKRRIMPTKRGHGGHVPDPYGLPQNWQSNSSIRSDVWDNELAVLAPVRPGGKLTTLYKPKGNAFVGDVDLHFDADKILFSSVGTHRRWQIFEIRADGTGLRQVTPGEDRDVNNYDACYLPNGKIIFSSTASMVAVPCVNGSSLVANFYIMDADGKNIRQLCFDQEHDWCPTVMNNGRVLYTRWEYTDTPHSHDRLLFHMNPDGTAQMEFYGSNSYWPNSIFYARPIPGHPTRVIAIVSGHHGVRRMGELVLFDPALGRREADGAVQRIPGYGKKVEAIIADNLVDASWPKFLHPYPLSGEYFIVSAQPTPASRWGIYLVDVFDNMVLLAEDPQYALLEPIPFRKTPTPPIIPDRIKPDRTDAVVYMADVYAGEGLKGVPRGAVKKLRLFTYTYLYPHMGGPQGVVGMEGPWDIKRVMGTVPVLEDGSAVFRIPANTPISVQPLDDEGKALQLMRSWFTAMPGEVLSCVGCHEPQNTTPPTKYTLAANRAPSEIKPWYGPTRGFAFKREVQPVLDRYCLGCHNGQSRPDGKCLPDLRGTEQITDYTSVFHHGGRDAGLFSVAYAELHRFVRRPGMESDYHMLAPLEYHADTTQIVQMLAKGHNGVCLDDEAWDRVITWIDLNAPYHGTWTEIAGPKRVNRLARRRRELMKRYANLDVDFEAIPQTPKYPTEPVMPRPTPKMSANGKDVTCPGWPFDAREAKRRQAAAGQCERPIELGGGIKLDLIRVPAGEFVMGDPTGHPDERPLARVKIARPFWMGRAEVTNEQYARFDPSHDSRVESKLAMQFGVRGFYVNGPRQPVVRVSWVRAMAFCEWLTARTNLKFALPTEAQWEYACRAGTATPFFYGDLNTDFARFANLADAKLREFVCHPYKKHVEPYKNPRKYDDWIPKDPRFNDGGFVSEDVGKYQPNAWGLRDMHGNVSEWTRSTFKPYPYRDDDGRNDPSAAANRVVRGGSWRDRPKRARSAFRLAYRPYQGVYHVGFRVVCETEPVVGETSPRDIAMK